ncbi:MAG: VWA domain-containing protein [Amphritea sp.]
MANYELIAGHDLIENPSPRCACMLVLDTSASMADGLFGLFSEKGSSPIDQLNQGVQSFIAELQADEVAACSVELGVITAGGSVTEQLPFTTAMSIDYCDQFNASGGTPLGEAVEKALQRLEERKAEYKKAGVAYFQPWLVVISDGGPTDSWRSVASRTCSLSEQRKLVVLPVGVEGAQMDILSEFSSRPALKLDGLKFREFFQWLSASMSRVSSSGSTTAAVNLPPMDGWSSI